MCMCACDTLLIVVIHNIKGDSEGQGILACCSPWGRRVGHDLATEQHQQHRINPRGLVISIQIRVQERDFAGGRGCCRVRVPGHHLEDSVIKEGKQTAGHDLNVETLRVISQKNCHQ